MEAEWKDQITTKRYDYEYMGIDRTVCLKTNTEISVQHACHVVLVLDYKWLIQSVACLKLFHYRRTLCLLRIEWTTRNCIHGKECNKTDNEDCKNRENNSLYNVLTHIFLSLLDLYR